MDDQTVEIAVYWLFCLLLCGGALIRYVDSGQRSHVAFSARQVGLTIAVTVVTINRHLPSWLLIAVIVAIMINVLLYNPSIPRPKER